VQLKAKDDAIEKLSAEISAQKQSIAELERQLTIMRLQMKV
jgi:uncharacterized coiled-coil protein SlyX